MSKHFLPDATLLASQLLESAYKDKAGQLLNTQPLLCFKGRKHDTVVTSYSATKLYSLNIEAILQQHLSAMLL